MSAQAGSASASVASVIRSSGRVAAVANAIGVPPGRISRRAVEGGAELPGPGARQRVVERDHEAGFRRPAQPAQHQLPRLEVVRQRDRAEVAAERRAEPGRHRHHRRDAWHHRHLQRPPFRIAMLDRLEHGTRHREHPGIARGHHRHRPARAGERQRVPGARQLLAIVRAVPHHVGAGRDPVEVWPVSDQVGRERQRIARLRRAQREVARTEPDHEQPPRHRGRCRPGISTMEK